MLSVHQLSESLCVRCARRRPAIRATANRHGRRPANIVDSLEDRTLLSNLLVNGDFSQGNTGFTSQYNYSSDLQPEGNYFVGYDPLDYHPNGANFGDHTTGTGLMLMANGAPTSITVWQETVNVSSSTDYTFSGWAASWGKNGDIFTDASPAQLEFLVNGVQIGSEFTLIAGDGQWSQFSASWNSATSTTATIQIVDMNTASFGNDFAVDDLIFDTSGAVYPQLVVTTQPPASVATGAGFGITVTAETSPGSVDTGFNGTVTAVLEENPTLATLGGTLTATATDGVATFSGLTIDTVGTAYTLLAWASGLVSAETNTFDVTAAPVPLLDVTTQPPSSVTAGSDFGLTVTAETSPGTVDTGFTGTVTVALENNPTGATLGGTVTATATDGVATFSTLLLDTAGTGYTLMATANGLTSAETDSFDVTPRQPPNWS